MMYVLSQCVLVVTVRNVKLYPRKLCHHFINYDTTIASWNRIAMEGCFRGICIGIAVRHIH